MNNWQQKTIGRALIDAEEAQLKHLLPLYSGRYMICLDPVISEETLAVSPIHHHYYCQPYQSGWKGDFHQKEGERSYDQIIGLSNELPLLSDSLDLIVAPHILDFSEEVKAIVKEFWRVLLPEGKAIIIGFNSTALFGLSHVLKNENHSTPLLAVHRLRKLLIAQGFALELFKTFFFRPTSLSEKQFKRMRFVEIVGDICWPYMGALYLFVVKKPVLGFTPLREKRRRERLIMPKGVAEPVGRIANLRKYFYE